jgi:hypothetical protein
MQIKLIQSEIETAITDYINKLFAIRDGMEIKINLSATRGDEGFIANIDITPPSAQRETTSLAPARVAEAPTASASAPRITRAPRQALAAAAPQEPAQSEDTAEGAEPALETVMAAGEAPADDTADNSPTPAPASTGRSLFAGMTSPKNS